MASASAKVTVNPAGIQQMTTRAEVSRVMRRVAEDTAAAQDGL